MSNKKRKPMNELPTMRPGMEIVLEVGEIVETTTAPIVPCCESISITVPYILTAPIAASYQDEAHRVDMGTLTQERMRKLKALRRGYVASDTRMEGGDEVRTNRDAIFCLLDSLDI